VRDYHSTAFPNPGRVKCVRPDHAAQDICFGAPDPGDWYGHLFRCSECFREYRDESPHVHALLKSEAGKFAMYEFLEESNFFIPSLRLVESIISHNRDLARQDLHEATGEAPGEGLFRRRNSGEGRAGYEMDDRPEVWQRNEGIEDRAWRGTRNAHEELSRATRLNQLEIAKILYGYLTVLSRSAEAQAGDPFDLRVIIPRGMGSRLGLMRSLPEHERFEAETYKHQPNENELFDHNSLEILHELTEEFGLWLAREQGGFYKAPWGEMRLGDTHYLFLSAAPRERRRRTRPYAGQAQYGPPSTQSDWRARK
jgi:hypothetical protein